jgi:hypothetical protein
MPFMISSSESAVEVLRIAQNASAAIPVGKIEVPGAADILSKPGVIFVGKEGGPQLERFVHIPSFRVHEARRMAEGVGATVSDFTGSVSVSVGEGPFILTGVSWDAMGVASDHFELNDRMWPDRSITSLSTDARVGNGVQSFVALAATAFEASRPGLKARSDALKG